MLDVLLTNGSGPGRQVKPVRYAETLDRGRERWSSYVHGFHEGSTSVSESALAPRPSSDPCPHAQCHCNWQAFFFVSRLEGKLVP